MPIDLPPNVAYRNLLGDLGRDEDPDRPRRTTVRGPEGPQPPTSSGPSTVGATPPPSSEPVHNATQMDIVAAFSVISDRTTAYLEDLKKCLEDMNKKIEELNKKMSEASKNASDLSGKKGDARGGNTSDYEKLARENQTLSVQHGDTKIEINLSFKSPGEKGKDGGFNKDQWSSISQQMQTDVSSVQTQVKTVSSDMQISVQNWQTFSNQLMKGLEQMTSTMGRMVTLE